MYPVSIGIVFVELTWVKQYAVQAGVKCTQLRIRASCYGNATQLFVPYCFSLGLNRVESTVAKLGEVLFGLFVTDERRGDTCFYFFSAFGLKSDYADGMIPGKFQPGLFLDAVIGSRVGKRFIECQNEIIPEIFRYPATVFRGITDHLTFFGNDLDE